MLAQGPAAVGAAELNGGRPTLRVVTWASMLPLICRRAKPNSCWRRTDMQYVLICFTTHELEIAQQPRCELQKANEP